MKTVVVGQNKVCLTHLYLLLVWYVCEVMTFFLRGFLELRHSPGAFPGCATVTHCRCATVTAGDSKCLQMRGRMDQTFSACSENRAFLV